MSEREIFTAAVALTDPARREAFLREACVGKEQLRRRIDALLRAHDNASAFLGTPAIEQAIGPNSTDAARTQPPAVNAADITTHANSEILEDLHADRTLSYLSPTEKPGSLGRLGHYEIEAVLGRGGFGTVLKAFDERLHRTVAIKMLSPALAATSPPRKRFLREARAAAAIRHPNVVAIYAVEDVPIPYFVMECVPGETLQQLLDSHGPLDVADVLSIGQQIASGLAAAHAQGLVHRDIKPSNILLDGGRTGVVRISDFGLARTADDASLTQSGTVAGTPLFMSPEQALGRSIDQRSDLFSLGSVLYQMVTGHPPFRASTTVAVLRRVVEDPPRPIAEIIPECPDWLSAIIAKLLAKSPDERIESAAELSDLLGQCLADLRANRPIRLPPGIPPAPRFLAIPNPPAGQPATSTPAQRATTVARRGSLIAAGVLVAALALGVTEATGVTRLAATVIRLTTGSGTLVIETDDPGIKVTIDGEEVQIQGAGVEQLTLKPGSYQVAGVKDGKPVSQQVVTIAKGEREVVRIRLEQNERQPAPAAITPSASDESERHVAEWAISKRAYVRLTTQSPGGHPLYHEPKSVADFPPEPVTCNTIVFPFGTKFSEAELERLLDAKQLDRLELFRTNLTDAGLEIVSRLESLAYLSIGQTYVTDAGLPTLRRLRNLKGLNLNGMPITAAGLRTIEALPLEHIDVGATKLTGADWQVLAPFPRLTMLGFQESANFGDADLAQLVQLKQIEGLHLGYTSVSNAGLSHLRQLSNLNTLFISNNPNLTDAAVEPLSHLSSLRELQAYRTNLTADGIARLHVALPECRILWDGGISEPESLVDRRAAEWVLTQGGSVCVNGEEHAIQSADSLPPTPFRLTSIMLHHRPQLSAGDLAKLEGLQHVEHLRLDGTLLTDDAMAPLAGFTSLRSLNLQSTNLTDQALVHLRNMTALEHLAIHDNPAMGNDGLAHLSGMTALKYFEARHTAIGDAGLKHIRELPIVIEIVLEGAQITDRGLEDLPPATTLTSVQLQDTAVTDAGLDSLASHSSLRSILLQGTQVTDAGVRKLSTALPLCHIEWDGGVIEPGAAASAAHVWPADAPSAAIAPFDAEQARRHQSEWAEHLQLPVEFTNSLGMQFRLIPPGEFQMGSLPEEIAEALQLVPENDEPWRISVESEGPQHHVVLTQPFYLGVSEVTQAQFEAVMGRNPSHFSKSGEFAGRVADRQTTDHPVEGVNWNDALDFCAKLSQAEHMQPYRFVLRAGREERGGGPGYLLPTEAQWEFACRAGTTTKYWSGDTLDDLLRAGWFGKNSGDRTHAVGELLPNPFGLFDVHGNVWELVQDHWNPDQYRDVTALVQIDPQGPSFEAGHAVRGGDHHDSATICRSAHRDGIDTAMSSYMWGFRVALTVDAVRESLEAASLSSNPDRRAAEWALSVGIPAEITVGNDKRSVSPGEKLPQERFSLGSVELRGSPHATDAGLAHFAGCRNLTHVNLSGNQVTDAGVSHFKDSKQLVVLSLENTAVTDAGLAFFAGCDQLTSLTLNDSPVSDTGLRAFQNCRELRHLQLSRTGVTDAGLAYFGNCPQLVGLVLGYTRITDAGLAYFRHCRDLSHLNLTDTQVSDAGMENFRDCVHLEFLVLNNTRVSDAGLACFRSSRKLVRLQLDNLGVTDVGFATFHDCTELADLTLFGAKVSDAALEPLSRCTKLTHLLLDNTHVSDAALAHLRDCRQLQRLYLDNTQVSDAGLAQLANCDQLQQVTLAHTAVGDAGLSVFADCRNLTWIRLLGTQLTDAGLKQLAAITSLTEIDLRRTAVTSDGVAGFHSAMPKCKITWDNGIIEPMP